MTAVYAVFSRDKLDGVVRSILSVCVAALIGSSRSQTMVPLERET